MRCKKHLSDATSGIGVCSCCLRERLLAVMAAQARAEVQAQEPQLSRLHSCAAHELPRKSDSHPPSLVFPRSVSPYVSRHRQFHHRFYSTPQADPTYNGTTPAFVTTGSVSRKQQRSRFAVWSSLFRARSQKLDSVPTDSSASSSSSSSWLSSIFSHRGMKQPKFCSVEGSVEAVGRRGRPSRFFSRGMSPDRECNDCRDGSPSAGGYFSEASNWKASLAMSNGSTRRGRHGPTRNVSGLAFCLSPLSRNWSAVPSEFPYAGEVRVPQKPHLSEAASFCANRSRKLSDLGRVNANR